MSRARNRADGDFGDLDISNIGAVSLDSIKGDADANTNIAFSGSDVITITTGGTTAATFNASQILTLSDDLIIKNSGTIGAANDTDLLTLGNGTLTVAGEVVGTGFTGTLDGILGSGTAAAATTTTLASTTITASGRILVDDTTEATSTTDGSLQTDGGLSVVGDAVFGDDVKLLSDASVLSFGADSDVTLTHVADTGILLNSTMAIQFNDASQFINAPSATVLDINADDEIELNATLVDVNANINVQGTYIGGGLMQTGGSIVIPDAGNIGSASDTNAIAIGADGDVTLTQDLELQHDGATLSFGANDDVVLTHVHDTGLLLNSTSVIQFRDSAINIGSSADGQLDIAADTEVQITTATVDINGILLVDGSNISLDSTSTLNIDNSNTSNGITIGTATSGVPISIGHTTSEVTVNDNMTVTGTMTQTGISTSTAKDIFNAGMSLKNGATSAGFVEFFEDSDNGTNKVTVIGPASTADVTVTLPSSAGTVALTTDIADEATALAIALG